MAAPPTEYVDPPEAMLPPTEYVDPPEAILLATEAVDAPEAILVRFGSADLPPQLVAQPQIIHSHKYCTGPFFLCIRAPELQNSNVHSMNDLSNVA